MIEGTRNIEQRTNYTESSNPLFIKADLLARKVYEITLTFPKHELYGLTSQLRRAALSVILNIIEGFARQTPKEYRRFLLISFGSLKETKYLLQFALTQTYFDNNKYSYVLETAEEVAKILWTILHPKQ